MLEELYIEGAKGINCGALLAALIGLGAEPKELEMRLSKMFLKKVEIETMLIHGKLQCTCITLKPPAPISIQEAMETIQRSSFGKEIKNRLIQAVKNWEMALQCEKQELIFTEADTEHSFLTLTAMAEAMELLGFAGCKTGPLYEEISKKFLSPGVLQVLKESGLPVGFSREKGEGSTLLAVCFLAAFSSEFQTGRIQYIKDWFSGAPFDGHGGQVKAVILSEENMQGEASEKGDFVQVLETNVDDCSGETLGYAIDCLMKAGALDACCFPIYMKKNRPAYMLQVICKKDRQELLEDIIFRETTSIGLRRYEERRRILPRVFEEIELYGHKIKIKICAHHDQKFYYPEYENVKSVSEKTGKSYFEIYDKAAEKAGKIYGDL